jgi:hypothetical protein
VLQEKSILFELLFSLDNGNCTESGGSGEAYDNFTLLQWNLFFFVVVIMEETSEVSTVGRGRGRGDRGRGRGGFKGIGSQPGGGGRGGDTRGRGGRGRGGSGGN